jgi:hypothetical protein
MITVYKGQNMAEKKKKRAWPSDEEMQKRLDDLEKLADQAIEGEYGEQRQSITDKLDLIRDTIQKFKGKNVPYTTIAKVIEDGVGLKVSEQTLRKYCQDKLGWPKRKKKKSENEEEINISNDTQNDNREIKEIESNEKANSRDNLSNKKGFA